MTDHKTHRITGVEPGGIAARLGLAAGDELLLVDGKPVQDVFDYRTAMATTEVCLTIRRDGRTVEVDDPWGNRILVTTPGRG